MSEVESLYEEAAAEFDRWETVKDVVDETIDLMLNHRQSGHPGGSRSKAHLLLSTMLSGAMRWDLLRPWRPFQDRFVLAAGHTVPLVYAALAVLNEAMRERHRRTGDAAFAMPDDGRWAVTLPDLLTFRRRGGLPGHAEMSGRTLFFKFNTGPSGHGLPAAAGEALALKLAGCEQVKVFALEGEGGLTAGASHETRNSAWGLGLSNLVVLLDWNDFGIDEQRISSVVPGTPDVWFDAYGWRVAGTDDGMEWAPVTRAVLDAARGENPDGVPSAAWVKTRKGRGYGTYDFASHGSPHPRNSAEFWEVRRPFMEKYGVEYDGAFAKAPDDPEARRRQTATNLGRAFDVLRRDEDLVNYLSDLVVRLAREVPDRPRQSRLGGRGSRIFDDARLLDARSYPAEMFAKPGERKSNKEGLAAWGAWINAYARKEYGRPLVVACSADLAESTGIAGFAKPFGELPGWGRYHLSENPTGTLLPQEITEFANAAMMAGLATVNLAEDPRREFDGFWGACSTYGAFAYLKYGPMRLFSQLAQDSDLAVGKVIWIAGHSGPETADDSRTHFGVFAPGVTQLFPEGQVIDLHPWEHNEVPVVLAAALREKAPIVALHLTRPPIEIPDREKLGIPSHLEAARGAYVIRDLAAGLPRAGTVIVQGTSTTGNLVSILPELDRRGINVKVVAAISPQLFRLQEAEYRERTVSTADLWDGMCITNRALRLMSDWIAHPLAAEYSLSSDRDGRWRTGGTAEEVVDEAGLSPGHILEAIERFARDRERRLARLREAVESAGQLSEERATMNEPGFWLEGIPAAITVTDEAGTIVYMNARSRETFAKDGGGALVGKSVFDCHPEPARSKTRRLYDDKTPNHYTIRKNGQRKIVHQLPWYRDGAFAGVVEIVFPIPDELPHFDRG
jgi:transketolase